MDAQQLAGQRSRIRQPAHGQVSLQQIAQAVGIGIEIGNPLQRPDRGFGVARLEQIASLHQQGVTVARVERKHALQDFVGAGQRSLCAQALGSG